MSETKLEDRIKSTINEAKELAEYWTGTLHEEVIRKELDTLVDAMHNEDSEAVETQLQTLENTLAQAREEIERSENEG